MSVCRTALSLRLLAPGNVRGSDPVAPDSAAVMMEEVITYYLKSRNVKYPDDPSHCELLLPLVCLGFSKGDMYNCFYTLLNKYIPRWVRQGMRRMGGRGEEGRGGRRGEERGGRRGEGGEGWGGEEGVRRGGEGKRSVMGWYF